MMKRDLTSQRCVTTLLGLQTNPGGGVRGAGYEEAMDSELPGAAPGMMTSGRRVRVPWDPLALVGGLGIHRLVTTSDVAKRDPGHVAQWQSRGLMKPLVVGSIPTVLSKHQRAENCARSYSCWSSAASWGSLGIE